MTLWPMANRALDGCNPAVGLGGVRGAKEVGLVGVVGGLQLQVAPVNCGHADLLLLLRPVAKNMSGRPKRSQLAHTSMWEIPTWNSSQRGGASKLTIRVVVAVLARSCSAIMEANTECIRDTLEKSNYLLGVY